MLGRFILSQLLTIFPLSIYVKYQNRRRDRLQAEDNRSVHTAEDDLDLTDWQQPSFRYIW